MNQGSSRSTLRLTAVLLALLALATGCGPKPALEIEPPEPPEPDPCALGPEEPLAARGPEAPIRIALDEGVDWGRAPVPSNDAERLVFRQCFETLVRVDCTGRVRPGLAEKWEASSGGRVWTFTLRPGARFWDGEQADAFALARAFRQLHGQDSTLPPRLRWFDAESVEPIGARRLRIAFSELHAGNFVVQYFAHPATAVVKFLGDRSRPVGTGPFRIEPGAGEAEIVLVPHRESRWNRPEDDGGEEREEDEGPVLRIRSAPGADPRDLLAEGADLVMARSDVFTEYAEQIPEFTVAPLPWDRIYVLLAPGSDAPQAAAPVDEQELARFRRDLAEQGSASDARPASSLVFDVTLSGSCPGFEPIPGARRTPPAEARIVYPAGDGQAELLAERVAALAIMSSPLLANALPGSYLARRDVSPRTHALPRARWPGALSGENEYGYVHPVRREVLDHCGLLTELRARVPWIVTGDDDRGPNLLPLVVTRPVAAIRRGLGGLRVDGDGTLLLDRAGWAHAGMTP